MVQRNPKIKALRTHYLFPEINKKKQEFLRRSPDAQLISLGIGDTTYPLPKSIANQLSLYGAGMSTLEGYSGYGPEQGNAGLRHLIASRFYPGLAEANEIFVSDGTKCDIGRLQVLFGSSATIAVQDPTYPVYVDTAVALGQGEAQQEATGCYGNIVYMPCTSSNSFFPDLEALPRTDLIYFCSPNNPTGAVATHEQLARLIRFAKKNRSVVIFDAAYSAYIQDKTLPRSIYEIDGAREVAIELGSFSKMAGFTGLRLGWSVFPKELRFEGGESISTDWNRIHTTFFNGASNIVQAAGAAVLEEEGWMAIKKMVEYYQENALLLTHLCQENEWQFYGGVHAPYLWVEFPGRDSWEVFDELLEQAHLVTTPGSGFGPSGNGFIRLSAFGLRETIETAVQRGKKDSSRTSLRW